MEEWQKIHITHKLDKLAELTICSSSLLASLKAVGALGEADVNKIENMKKRKYEALELYRILQTRQNGYEHLANALHTTSQKGALDIILQGFPLDNLLNLKVDFLGKITKLENILPKNTSKEIITNLKSALTPDDYIKYVVKNTYNNDDPPIKLITNTIPPELSYYIPRKLSRRTPLNPEIFRTKSLDIFVFKGMKRHELSQLVRPYKTAVSGRQIEDVTARFIFLENYEDWYDIQRASKLPVHLIQFENGAFTLEETSGGSQVISHFLSHPARGTTNLKEIEFLVACPDTDARGICISDAPGTGKSALLANLSRMMCIEHQDRIVAFIQLADMIKNADRPPSLESTNGMKFVLDYISSGSHVAREILLTLLENTSTKMELFLDGFDEVAQKDLEWTKCLLKKLTQTAKNIKIYITSRPHLRHELEESLGLIPYDILPFNKASQINFLVKYWSQSDSRCNPAKLSEFATSCIESFRKNLRQEEEDIIVGIPLQCRLIAEVYAKEASIYSKSDMSVQVEDVCTKMPSMYDLYKNFVDGSRASLNSDEIEGMVNFHILKAFSLLYPEISEDFAEILMPNADDPKNMQKYFSLGILEEVHTGNSLVMKFVHQSFAEYLVTEFIGKMLTTQETSKIPMARLVQVLYEHILLTTEAGHFRPSDSLHPLHSVYHIPKPEINLFSFTNSQVVYFLNSHLKIKPLESIFCKSAVDSFSNIIETNNLYQILLGCAHQNFLNIFMLTKELKIKGMKSKVTVLPKQLCWYRCGPAIPNKQELRNIFLVACEHASVQLVDEYANLIRQLYSFDIKNFGKYLQKTHINSPLASAVERQNINLLETLLGTFPVEGYGLITKCVENSHDDSMDTIEIKKNMMRLLLSKDKVILQEEWAGTFPPIFLNAHVELIKFLVQEGADIAEVIGDDITIAEIAPTWMSPDEYHELVCFIIENCKAIDLFVRKTKDGKREFHTGIGDGNRLKRMKKETIEIILEKCDVDINVMDEDDDNPLLHCVIRECGLDVLNVLINRGANVHAGNNLLLHVAAFYGNVEACKCFVFLGLNIHETSAVGNNVIHIAAMTGNVEVVGYFAGLGVDIHATNSRGENVLHQAAKLGNLETTQFLVTLGVNMHATNQNGYTVLHIAALAGRIDIAQYYVALKKLDIHAKSHDGHNVLHLAALMGNVRTAHYFVSLGVDYHATGKNGDSVLHLAAGQDHVETAKYFVSMGVDAHAKNNDGNNVLHVVAMKGGIQTAQYFVSLGVDAHALNDAGNSVLHLATLRGDVELVQYFVSLGVDPHCKNKLGTNLLHLVPLNGNVELAKYFVSLGVDPHATNDENNNVLHLSIPKGDMELVQYFVSLGVDVHGKNDNGNNVIHLAALEGNVELTKYFVSLGVDAHAKNNDGDNGIHIAAFVGDPDIAQYFVSLGVDMHAIRADGNNVLHIAVMKEDMQTAQHFVSLGVDVHAKNNNGNNVLHFVALTDSLELAEYFVSLGVDGFVKDNDGDNVLHTVALNGNAQLAKYFVSWVGADVHLTNNDGNNAAHLASMGGNVETAQIFVSAGVDVHAKNKTGNNVLHLATLRGDMELVQYFVALGVDAHARNDEGDNVLHIAAMDGNEEVARYFISLGVDAHATNSDGLNALHSAALGGHLKMAKYLTSLGVDAHAITKRGNTLLHVAAACSDNVELAKHIVSLGADIHAVNKEGENVVLVSALKDNLEMGRYLISLGVDAHLKNSNGDNVLYFAALNGSVDTVKYFTSLGVDVQCTNEDGNSILHAVATSGNVDLAKYFVEQGLDVKAVNKDGANVLHFAAASGNVEMAKYFVAMGVDIHARDKSGDGILDIAALGGNADSISYFLSIGSMNAEGKYNLIG